MNYEIFKLKNNKSLTYHILWYDIKAVTKEGIYSFDGLHQKIRKV